MTRTSIIASAIAAAIALPISATADTLIEGGNLVDQTWTAAGSPYIVRGDVTVPAGRFLRIEAGTEVRFAYRDRRGTGRDTDKVELTIHGSLRVNGEAARPVTLGADAQHPRAWYGIIVGASASSVRLRHATVRHAVYAMTTLCSNSALDISDSRFDRSHDGLRIEGGGDLRLNRLRLVGNHNTALYLGPNTSAVLNHSVIAESNRGIWFQGEQRQLSISHVTLHRNAYAVHADPARPGGSVTIVDSIISGSQLPMYTSPNSTMTISYSDLWDNREASLGIPYGAGVKRFNPLYVSDRDPRLTSNSPLRFAATDLTDLGGLPFDGAPTQELVGTLWSDTVLTAAKSPYLVRGDVRVPRDVTLRIEPGVTLNFAPEDILSSDSPGRPMLSVRGTLIAVGEPERRITFQSTTGEKWEWEGIWLNGDTSRVVLDYVDVRHALSGTSFGSLAAGSSIKRSRFELNYTGLTLRGAPVAVDAVTLMNNDIGIDLETSAVVTNALVRRNTTGVLATYGEDQRATLTHSTVVDNDTAILLNARGAGAAMSVSSSIVSGNEVGVERSDAGRIDVRYSNVWGNDVNYRGTTPGEGTISADPKFVSYGVYRLEPGSPCIDTGAVGVDHDLDGTSRPRDGDGSGSPQVDMGAYELATGPVCGDGASDGAEACDSGPRNGEYGHCNLDCSGPGPRCGDAVVNGPELCDDGNRTSGDGCSDSCTFDAALRRVSERARRDGADDAYDRPAPMAADGGCQTGRGAGAGIALLAAAFVATRRRRRAPAAR